jgi:hypothetical protein
MGRNQSCQSKPQNIHCVQRDRPNPLAARPGLRYENAMKKLGRALYWLMWFAPILASAQIDPVKRDLIQLGYNAAFEGHAPLAAYAFFYHNQPDWLAVVLQTATRRFAAARIIPVNHLTAMLRKFQPAFTICSTPAVRFR